MFKDVERNFKLILEFKMLKIFVTKYKLMCYHKTSIMQFEAVGEMALCVDK